MAKVLQRDTDSWIIDTRSKPRRFYVGIALFMTAIVVAGFWQSYFGPMLHGVVSRPWIIQLHGIIFTGWMILLLAQVTLVAIGRTSAHRRVGNFGIVYGVVVFLMGLAAGVAAPVMHAASGEWTRDRAAGFFLITLGDMAVFGTLFLAAVVYRRKSEIHKRLILLATVALLFAAVGRMEFLTTSPVLFLAVWLSPVLVGMIYDAITIRRIHVVYIVGLPALLIAFTRVFFTESEAWLRIGRVLLAFFM